MLLHRTILILLLAALGGCSGDTKPTTDEVESSLRVYLLAEKAKSCGGNVTVEHLRVTEVGDFDKQNGGWPVYANFAVTCTDGMKTTTWNSNDPSEKVMASVVRKNALGEYECFMPERFRAAEEQMERQVDNLMKK